MLCTLVRPDRRARRSWPATTWSRERDEVRRNIGLVFQDTTLDDYLTAEQNLRLHAELYGMPRDGVDPAHAAGDGDGRPVGAAGAASSAPSPAA